MHVHTSVLVVINQICLTQLQSGISFTGIDTLQKSVFDFFFSKSVQNIGQSKSLQLAFMIKISILFISAKHIKVHINPLL